MQGQPINKLNWVIGCYQLEIKVKEESEKVGWLKTQLSKTEIMAAGPITSWQIDGETIERVKDYFFGPQNHCGW